jgi:hypothetical protein
MLVQIRAPHFTAAVILTADVVTEAAPILAWIIGKRRQDLSAHFRRKGWTAIVVAMEERQNGALPERSPRAGTEGNIAIAFALISVELFDNIAKPYVEEGCRTSS